MRKLYLKTKTIANNKSVLTEKIKQAIEELSLIRKGKSKGIPAKQLLNEF